MKTFPRLKYVFLVFSSEPWMVADNMDLQYVQAIQTGTEPFTGNAQLLTSSFSVAINALWGRISDMICTCILYRSTLYWRIVLWAQRHIQSWRVHELLRTSKVKKQNHGTRVVEHYVSISSEVTRLSACPSNLSPKLASWSLLSPCQIWQFLTHDL